MTVDQWKANTFAPVELTEDQKVDIKRIALGLVQDTLVDYDEFDSSMPRALNPKYWKPVRTRDALTIYTERTSSAAEKIAHGARSRSSGSNSASDSSETEWQAPRLLVGTGTIPGTLDDVMYGTMAPDEAQLMQSTAFASVRTVDGQLLAAIEKPTPDQPYRSLTLQMTVNEPLLPAAIRNVVKSRDLVIITATGILKRGKNERIGYHLYHSLDLPDAPSQQNISGIVRARLSQSTLFREVSNGTVDVYIKGYFEAFGHVMDSVATKVVANGLLLSHTASELAYHRKLTWILQSQREYEFNNTIVMEDTRRSTVCAECSKRFRPLRKKYSCRLCGTTLCANCGVDRRSIDIVPRLKAVRKLIKLCRRCVTRVTQECTYWVARQEVLAGRYENREGTTLVYTSRVHWTDEDSVSSSNHNSCEGEMIDLGKMSLSSVVSTPMGSFVNLATPGSSVRGRSFSDRSTSMDFSDDGEWNRIIAGSGQSDVVDAEQRAMLDDSKRQNAWVKMTEKRIAAGAQSALEEEKFDSN